MPTVKIYSCRRLNGILFKVRGNIDVCCIGDVELTIAKGYCGFEDNICSLFTDLNSLCKLDGSFLVALYHNLHPMCALVPNTMGIKLEKYLSEISHPQ